MALVQDSKQIKANIRYLESKFGSQEHSKYVELGICFIAYDTDLGTAFAPSRFIGYADNSFKDHSVNSEKDGKETNPIISKILNSNPTPDEELESLYQSYCKRIGFEPRSAGTFGVQRKYWDCRGIL